MDIVAARNLAASHVNEQGGLLGGDTYRLVQGDSQCDPKAAVDAGAKLVNVEQAVMVIGPNCSGATNGMAQSVTIPAGVAMLSDTATAPSISELDDNDLVFRVAPSDAYQGRSPRRARLGARLPQARGHLRQRRLQLRASRRVRGRLHRARPARSPATRRTSRARRPTAPSWRRWRPAGRKGSPSSPTSARAASPSCATASRTRSSTSFSARTA